MTVGGPADAGDRSVHGKIHGSTVITGDHNTVLQIDGSIANATAPTTPEDAAAMLFVPRHPEKAVRPTLWLRPGTGIVDIEDRPETGELRSWCLDPSGALALLVVGPGGQGKTQLAHQVVQEMAHQGWLAGFLDLPVANRNSAHQSLAVLRRRSQITAAVHALPGLGVPTLLVVDYAETHLDSLAELLLDVRRLRAGSPIRVLLLARDDRPWWNDLLAELPGGIADPEPLRLQSLWADVSPQAQLAVWTEAVQRYAAAITDHGIASDAVHPWVPAADLTSRFETTLDLYADALLYVLDRIAGDQPGVNRPQPGRDPIAGIVDHERRTMARTFASDLASSQTEQGGRCSPATGRERDLAAVAAFLHPASSHDEGVEILARVPAFANATVPSLRRVASVLARLYPSTDPDWLWGPPRPDRLADTFILDVAERCHSDRDWLDEVVAICDSDHPMGPAHCAVVLLRCLSTPNAEQRYAAGLRRIERTLDRLIEVAPAAYVPILTFLAARRFEHRLVEAVADRGAAGGAPGLDFDDLIAFNEVLQHQGAGAGAAGVVTAVWLRLVAEQRSNLDGSDKARSTLAGSLLNLSGHLSDVGRRHEALAAAEEASTIYLGLSDADVEPVDMADAVAILGHRYCEVGRLAEAREVLLQACTIRLEIIARDASPRHSRALANTLNVLGGVNFDLGRRQDALEASAQAVHGFLGSAASDPSVLDELAIALNNHSIHLAALGQRQQALQAAQEASRISGNLMAADPDAYRQDAAVALTTLGNRLGENGRLPEAVAALQEAVEHCRALVELRADVYEPGLAKALLSLGIALDRVDLPEQALAATREVVEIRRRHAQADPATFLPNYAMALGNLGVHLARNRLAEEALSATQEALSIFCELAAEEPAAHLIHIGGTLINMGRRLGTLGRYQDALDAVDEAIDVFTSLAKQEPVVFKSNLEEAHRIRAKLAEALAGSDQKS